MIGEGFKGYAQAAVRVLAYQHRQAAQPVAGSQNTVRRHQQDRDRAFDHLLRVQNALHQIFLHIDEGCHQLGDIDLSAALGHELMPVVGEIGIDQLVDVVDDTHRADGVQAQMGAHQQRLWVGVADAAHADVALELMQRAFKFRAEGGVFNIVDLPDEPGLRPVNHHAAPAGTQMGVVVRAEKYVQSHIPVGDRSKITAHYAKNSWERVMGSMYWPSL